MTMPASNPFSPPPAPVGNNKAYAAVAAGAITTILVYCLSLAHIVPPDPVVGAAQTLITLAAVYFTPHGG